MAARLGTVTNLGRGHYTTSSGLEWHHHAGQQTPITRDGRPTGATASSYSQFLLRGYRVLNPDAVVGSSRTRAPRLTPGEREERIRTTFGAPAGREAALERIRIHRLRENQLRDFAANSRPGWNRKKRRSSLLGRSATATERRRGLR